MQNAYHLSHMDSPIGRLHLMSHTDAIVAISFNRPTGFDKGCPLIEDARAHHDVKEQILAYFAGERRHFDFKMRFDHLPAFVASVLSEMAKIPYGQTRTYGEIAARVGSPLAFRAVGSACKRNPILLALGCHRVVARSGIGGFSCGLWRKEFLLDLERSRARE